MGIAWTLLSGGTEKTLKEWGFSRLRRSLVNLDPDKVTFTHQGARADSDPLFDFDDEIVIKKDGDLWFVGNRGRCMATGNGTGEGLQYEVLGGWSLLEQFVFQQIWKVTNGVADTLIDASRAMCIINQDTDGSKMHTGAAITAALNYAIACGANFQIGTIGVDAEVPFVQLKDLTVAEVVRNLLRWTPDAVVWFDYTTTRTVGMVTTPCPTIHIVRRGDAVAVSRAVVNDGAGDGAQDFSIEPRYDLLVPAVALKYSQVNTIDGVAFTSQTVDVAPAMADDTQKRTLVADLPIQGWRQTVLSQYLKTAAILLTGDGSDAFWLSILPPLRDSDTDTITAIEISDTQLELSADAIAAGKVTGDFPAYIVAGDTPSWFPNRTFQVTARAKISYVATDSTGNQKIIGPTPVAINLQGTSLGPVDTTYSYVNVEEFGEDVPPGLAAQIYAALSVLQYQGSATFKDLDCPGNAVIGKNLNLTGGRAEWATMAAQIQSITEDIDRRITEIGFGPAGHLGGADLLEMLRAARNWSPSNSRVERIEGTPSGNANADGSIARAGEGFGVAPDLHGYAFKIGSKYLAIKLKQNTTIGAIPTDLTIEPRIEQRAIIEDGVAVIKNVATPLSDTFDP